MQIDFSDLLLKVEVLVSSPYKARASDYHLFLRLLNEAINSVPKGSGEYIAVDAAIDALNKWQASGNKLGFLGSSVAE